MASFISGSGGTIVTGGSGIKPPKPPTPGVKPGTSHPLTTTTGQKYIFTTDPNGQVHFSPPPAAAGGAPPAQPPAQPPAGPPQSGATAAALASPLDSTYYGNVASNQFKVGNQINSLNLQGAADQTALQAALGQLAYQQPRDELGLEQKYNAGGGLYSSVYDQALGNLNNSYQTRQTAAQSRYATQADSLAARIAALQGSLPLYDADQAAAAAARSSNLAAKNPALGAVVPAPKVSPLAASIAAAKTQLAPGTSHPLTTTTGQKYTVSTNASGKVHFTAKKKGKK